MSLEPFKSDMSVSSLCLSHFTFFSVTPSFLGASVFKKVLMQSIESFRKPKASCPRARDNIPTAL